MERAVVSSVLSLVSVFLEESRLLFGVQNEVRVLEMKLKEIQCLLDDAERRPHDNKTSRNWITQIKDLAHRAEDVILTYAVKVSSRRGQKLKQRIQRFSCIMFEVSSLHQIGMKIKKITSDLDSVTRSMQSYGLKTIIEGESSTANTSDNQRWKRLAFPIETEDFFVGKDEELNQLLSLMIEDRQHHVIALWGIGGIGKTSIARKVYNHIDARNYFHCFAWVCITQQCGIRSVLEDVLKQLTQQKTDPLSNFLKKLTQQNQGPAPESDLSEAELITQLCKVQISQRCLIVLDDLWKIDHWAGMKHAFLIEGSKSKILLTTRNNDIANIGYAFEVGLLKMHDGWELLKKKASPESNYVAAEQGNLLQKIGEEMVERCGYLPLVISLLGGVLSTRKSLEEWELVKKNISVHLYKGKGVESENEIDEVLRLSYDDLPFYLKPCFLSMGQFPDGETVEVSVLYRQWIARGMISHENQGSGSTLMDNAEVYLGQLASRCIVQVEVNEYTMGEKYIKCNLHPVIRDLCLLLGEKEEFGLKVIDFRGGRFSPSLAECLLGSKTRHLVIDVVDLGELEHGESTISGDLVRNVRSLMFRHRIDHDDKDQIDKEQIPFPHLMNLHQFKFLQELSFENFIFPEGKLPKGIDNLILLRSLVVRGCVLSEVPSSIRKLLYLCTLDLLNSEYVRMPNIMKKMHRLKHLLLPRYKMESTDNYVLRLGEGLEELETLLGFDSKVHELTSINTMKNLRRFGAVIHDYVRFSVIIDAVTTAWENLCYSTLTIAQDCEFTLDEELNTLKKVFACSNLHELNIYTWIGNLLGDCRTEVLSSKLQWLTLCACKIEDDPMEVLGKLPFLKKLQLLNDSFVGEKMKCCASGFPRLKFLTVHGLKNVRRWRVEQGAMPLLSEIWLSHCPRLKMVPDGLRFLGNLQRLTFRGMPELGNRVLTSDDGVEGSDFNKVRHVPFVTVIDG